MKRVRLFFPFESLFLLCLSLASHFFSLAFLFSHFLSLSCYFPALCHTLVHLNQSVLPPPLVLRVLKVHAH